VSVGHCTFLSFCHFIAIFDPSPSTFEHSDDVLSILPADLVLYLKKEESRLYLFGFIYKEERILFRLVKYHWDHCISTRPMPQPGQALDPIWDAGVLLVLCTYMCIASAFHVLLRNLVVYGKHFFEFTQESRFSSVMTRPPGEAVLNVTLPLHLVRHHYQRILLPYHTHSHRSDVVVNACGLRRFNRPTSYTQTSFTLDVVTTPISCERLW